METHASTKTGGAPRSRQPARSPLEETLDALLDAEADAVRRTGRRMPRVDGVASALPLHPASARSRGLPFETALVERYCRHEISVEEALMEMYLADLSVRRVEDIAEMLWSSRVSPSVVGDLNRKLHARIGEWLARPITGEHTYLFLGSAPMKTCAGGGIRRVAVQVAVSVNARGFREVAAVREATGEGAEGWRHLLRDLAARGLRGTRLVVGGDCDGIAAVVRQCLPGAAWQRCAMRFHDDAAETVPQELRREASRMLKAIHAGENRAAAAKKALDVAAKLDAAGLSAAARAVREGAGDTLAHYDFPSWHWRSLRTNSMMERLLRDVRSRARAIGVFPDAQSAVMLVAARLRHVAATTWGERCYLSPMHFIDDEDDECLLSPLDESA